MSNTFFTTLPFAQAQAAGGGIAQILFMLVAFGAIMYFLMIRPQQQQRKKHEEMVSHIKRGDRVILQSGLHGKVTHVGDTKLNVEIAPDVIVEQVKSMILSVESKPVPQAAKKTAAKSSSTKSTKKIPAQEASDSKAPAKKTTRTRAKKHPLKKPIRFVRPWYSFLGLLGFSSFWLP